MRSEQVVGDESEDREGGPDGSRTHRVWKLVDMKVGEKEAFT